MASRKPRSANAKKKTAKKPGSRSLWKGSISFGLVNIPVALHPAEAPNELSFQLLDRRNFSPVHYRRVNVKTGQEVPWSEIVKGYQYKKGEYVALSEADFENASIEATHTIDITDFVDAAEISPIFYERPYYLEPLKTGQKSYALLRDAMRRTGKVGIGKIVIRSREHLAAIMPIGRLLVLNLLRFDHELRDARFDGPAERMKIDGKEIEMAKRLVESMVDEWNPKKYQDEYRADLMKLIENRIKAGQTKNMQERAPKTTAGRQAKVIDIMDLLKRSVETARRKEAPRQRRKAG
jgi:DNA end-binding protein Ku